MASRLEDRGTGRTTALMLHAIAAAIDARGKSVEFWDHWDRVTQDGACHHISCIGSMCENLGLIGLRHRIIRQSIPPAGHCLECGQLIPEHTKHGLSIWFDPEQSCSTP